MVALGSQGGTKALSANGLQTEPPNPVFVLGLCIHVARVRPTGPGLVGVREESGKAVLPWQFLGSVLGALIEGGASQGLRFRETQLRLRPPAWPAN